MTLSEQQTSDLVSRIVAAVHPDRVILFGSLVRGEAGPNSDIDLLVVAPEGCHRRKTAQVIYRALWGFGLSVDVIVALPSDLDLYGESPALIYQQALREGRELYAA